MCCQPSSTPARYPGRARRSSRVPPLPGIRGRQEDEKDALPDPSPSTQLGAHRLGMPVRRPCLCAIVNRLFRRLLLHLLLRRRTMAAEEVGRTVMERKDAAAPAMGKSVGQKRWQR